MASEPKNMDEAIRQTVQQKEFKKSVDSIIKAVLEEVNDTIKLKK